MGYSTLTYNGQSINVLSIRSRQIQGTLKQRVGRTVIQNEILGRALQDKVLTVRFQFQGTVATLDTARSTLRASNDADKHALVNGIDDDDYVITSLEFDESGDRTSELTGTVEFTQFQQ